MALAPLGGWTLVPILAAGGIVVALVVRFTRPEPLAAVPHIIDSVFERNGRLNDRNAAVTIGGAAVGIGFGMPLGADTPSAMIGGHLGSITAIRLGWPSAFVRALIVAGVAAGISSTFLAQLAAVVFAFEVVLGGFGGIVFVVPTLIAVGTAGFVTYQLVGTPAQYPIPPLAVHWDAVPAPLPCAGAPRWDRRHRVREPPEAVEAASGPGSSCRRSAEWPLPVPWSDSWPSGCPRSWAPARPR